MHDIDKLKSESRLKVERVQMLLQGSGLYAKSIDGIAGAGTRVGLSKYVSDGGKNEEALELWADLQEEEESNGNIIQLQALTVLHYSGKMKKFWLNADVVESYAKALREWELMGMPFRMTESLRTVQAQAVARRRKPTLCVEAGYSMHGHGLATDVDVNHILEGCIGAADRVKRMDSFYRTFAKYGWYNIHSTTNHIENMYGRPEQWHLQKTDPGGITSRVYLRNWARLHGATPINITNVLTDIRYEYQA
jgi:hypothetical protein